MIYLDNSATSFYKPDHVKKAVIEAVEKYTANSGRGSYDIAREVALKIAQARENAQRLFGKNFDCIFTSGCSLALNLAILGTSTKGCHIITTYLEHNSVLRVLEALKQNGIADYTVLFDLSQEAIQSAIRKNTTTIITTHVSNVTGEQVDIDLFSKIAKKYKLLYILDSAQSAGHIDANYEKADLVAFAGHKGLMGIQGAGGLMIKKGIVLKPILFGGTGHQSLNLTQPTDLPEGFEVGTLSTIPILSLSAGIEYFLDNKNEILAKEEKLNNYMLEKLQALDFITLYSNPKNCKGVFAFNIKDFDSGLIGDILNEEFNICVRTGFQCAPLVHKKLNTIQQGVVRASISADNSFDDIDVFINALIAINEKLSKL